MTQDTKLQQLVINKLTTAQYQAALDAGTIDPNQLYMTTDSQTLRDVTVDGSSIVSNNTVALGTMALETASNYSTKAVADTLYAQKALETTVAGKLDKISTASKVYGTDVNGNQTSYDITSFGNVDDVKVGTTSVVANKIATLGTMAGQPTTNYYTKSEIDGKLSAGMHYKGTVASYNNLPSSDNQIGDLYNVTDTGANYAWSGTAWDKLSENIDLSGVVPNTRTINGKELSTNITLTASDVGALPSSTVIPTVDQTYNGTSTNAQSGVAIAGAGFLKNTATGANSLGILGSCYSSSSVVVGNSAQAGTSSFAWMSNVVVGSYAKAINSGQNTAIGCEANCSSTRGIALGYEATVSSYNSYQIGPGTNSDNGTLYVGFYDGDGTRNNYKLLGNNGLIPNARLNTMTGADGTNAGTAGIIPAPTATDNTKFLRGDGTWATVSQPSIATTSTAGLVKPDGTSIIVDANGVISSTGGAEIDNETITQNGDNELQTVAIVNPNTNSGAISPLKIWNGSQYQWTNGEATVWNYWQTSETSIWAASTMPSSAKWRSVTYGDGKFVVVAESSDKAAYSTDGINWTASTLPSSASWRAVTYGDGKFVVVAERSTKSAYSTDGINWTASTLPSSTSWREVTYGDGKFVVVANGNDKAAAFTIQYDKCYTLDSIPTTSSQVYSAPETTSTKTITSVGSGTITLSDNLVYNSTPSGNQNTYRTLGVAHPNWICNINNVGVKIGNTIIATDGSDLLPSQSGNNGKFLTTNGTTASWGNVTIPFGESTSAADAVQKEVTISEITELKTGQIIIVKPTITSTVADATLKLNNFTAYPMLYGAAAITTSTDSITWAANYPSWFRFDGSNWVFLGHGVDNNTTYSAMSVSEGTTGTKTTARSVRADYLKQIIQGTTLTGLSTSTNSAVVATDTVTTGIGKLQAQVNNKVDKTSIATTSTAGLVKPDGTSITIDSNGTISASAGAYAMVIVDYTAEEE